MEYKEDRNLLKDWMIKMDNSNKLETYKEGHFTPPDMRNI